MTNTITLTTTNKELLAAFNSFQIEGAKYELGFETKDFGFSKKTFKVMIIFSSTVAINLFSTWLYNQLASSNDCETQIENQSISKDTTQITNIIMQHVTINNYNSNESPYNKSVSKK